MGNPSSASLNHDNSVERIVQSMPQTDVNYWMTDLMPMGARFLPDSQTPDSVRALYEQITAGKTDITEVGRYISARLRGASRS